MLKKRIFLLAAIVIVFIVTGSLIFLKLKQTHIIKGYVDSTGVVYECSKPIKAKYGTDGGFPPQTGYVLPANQAEANKYCHGTGVV